MPLAVRLDPDQGARPAVGVFDADPRVFRPIRALGSRAAYFQTLGRSADVTFRTDLYSSRGFGYGMDVRTRANSRSYLNFGFFAVKDRVLGTPGRRRSPRPGRFAHLRRRRSLFPERIYGRGRCPPDLESCFSAGFFGRYPADHLADRGFAGFCK